MLRYHAPEANTASVLVQFVGREPTVLDSAAANVIALGGGGAAAVGGARVAQRLVPDLRVLRRLGAGDTVYAIGRRDELRKLAAASTGGRPDVGTSSSDPGRHADTGLGPQSEAAAALGDHGKRYRIRV